MCGTGALLTPGRSWVCCTCSCLFAGGTTFPRIQEFHEHLLHSCRHRNLKGFLWQSIRGTQSWSCVPGEVLGKFICVITWWHQDPSPGVWDLQTGISVTANLFGAHQHWTIKLPKEGWKKAVMFSKTRDVPAVVPEKLFWFHSIKSARTCLCTSKRKIQIFVGFIELRRQNSGEVLGQHSEKSALIIPLWQSTSAWGYPQLITPCHKVPLLPHRFPPCRKKNTRYRSDRDPWDYSGVSLLNNPFENLWQPYLFRRSVSEKSQYLLTILINSFQR